MDNIIFSKQEKGGFFNMNFKYKVFILLFLVFIVGISAVSASDDVDNNMTLSEPIISYDDSSVDIVLSEASSSDEDVLSASRGTFMYLQELIDNDTSGTITLDSNYAYAASDSSLLSGIVINKSLTINGAGHSIDGKSKARIFNISANNVIIENLTLQGGYKSDDAPGAAILWQANDAKIRYCTFTNNIQPSSSYEFGMCIYYSGSNILIDNCLFRTTGGNGWRNGLYLTGKNATVINCNFSRLNSFFVVENMDKVNFTNNRFLNQFNGAGSNTVSGYQRPLYINKVNNVTFNDNYLYKSASVARFFSIESASYIDFIHNTFYDVSFTGGNYGLYIYHTGYCNFSHNNFTKVPAAFVDYQVRINSNGINGNGFAYILNNTFDLLTSNYAESLQVTNHKTAYLYNNIFSNGLASTQANEQCALWLANIDTAIVHNNNFTNETSFAHAIYSSNLKNLDCDNNLFYDVGDSGHSSTGRICRFVSTVGNFTNNKFIECYCNAPEDSNIVGAICSFEKSTMNFTYNLISNYYSTNPLQSISGLLHVIAGTGSVNFINNTFKDNVYDSVTGTGIIDSKLPGNITNNTFINNVVAGDGACVYNEGANSNISLNHFISNSVTGIGGAIYNKGNSVIISNNDFNDIHADVYGGVIYSDASDVLVNYNTIVNSYSNIAGALYISGNRANVSSNYFNNVSAVNYGVLYSDSLDSIFENNTYHDNYAESEGIVAIQDRITLNYENFTDNHVTNGQAGTIIFIGDNSNVNNTFINNTYALVGGAIVNNGNHNSLNNVTINNSQATNTFGGAIYSTGDYFNVNDLKVFNSYALNDGGAIYNTGAYGNLSNSCFDLVYSGHDGGVIYWVGDNGEGSGINITNVNATRNGGAIFWVGSNGRLSDIKIINSTAYGEGGAIYWTGSSGTISNFDIRDIHVNGGAAVSWTGIDGTIEKGSFSYIYSIGDGGAIYWTGAGATLSFINFTHINSTANGGAIYGTSIDSFMENLTFTDVNSTANGGAIFWTGSNGNAYNLTFIGTHSPTNGGAIYWTGSKSNIKSSKFKNVTSGISGGSVYWSGADSTFDDVNFTDTFSDIMGGAVFWSGASGTIANSNFINISSNAGGAISWNADLGTLINVNFMHTNASTGGAIYWIGETPVFNILNITDSNATSKGGAIYLSGSNAILNNLYLENNYAGTDGGAINFEGVNSKLYDSQFINNFADGKAGAIAWLSAYGEIYNNNFTNNTGAIGGAVYINADNNNLSNLNFTNNFADIGGALYVSGLTNNSLHNSNFTNNNASTTGGAIYWFSSNGILENVNINEANAVHGGAIYWVGTEGNLSDLSFNNVYATENGGGIYVLGSTVSIDGVNFSNINATDGGAIYWIGHFGKLDHATFENNSVTNNGGALYVAGNDFELNHATFNNNNASNYGAGIFWSSSGNISNVELTYNRAHSGSAIYNGGELTLINASILNNKADIRSIEIVTNETSTDFVAIAVLRGYDNFLNGIWTNSRNINVQNVTYWGVNGTMKTPNYLVTPVEGVSESNLFFDTRLSGINASIHIYNDEVESYDSGSSDIYGRVFCSIYKYETTFNITANHYDDLYYTATQIQTSANSSKLNATLAISLKSDEVPFNSNATVFVTLVDEINHIGVGLNGTVSLYLDGGFWMNVTVVDGNATVSEVIPRETGNYNISAHYDGGYFGSHRVEELYSNVVDFFVVKSSLPIDISINSTVIHAGDLISISISGPSNYTGKVQYVAGDYSGFVDLNTIYSFNATYYNNETVHILAFALGDGNYLSGVANLSFEVIKNDLKMEFINISDISVGDLVIITVKFNVTDVTGNVIINIGDVDYNATISDGYAQVSVYNLINDTYTVNARYPGSNYYNVYGNITAEFKVSKINTTPAVEFNSDVHVGENAIISINVTSNNSNHLVNGFVTVDIGNNQYNVSVNNGVASLTLNNLNAGDNSVNIVYLGDHQFNGCAISSNIHIYKVDTSISADVAQSEIYSTENAVFVINVNSAIANHIVNGFVTATIGGGEYNVSINNGVGYLTVPALPENIYNLSVSYAGDGEFNGCVNQNASSVTVNKINVSYVTAISKPIYVGQDAVVNIKVFSDVPKYVVNGYVNVYVNGSEYKTPIINGSGSLTIFNLLEGSYPINITYDGDNLFNNNTFINVAYINVNKINIDSINVTPNNQIINVTESATLVINLTSAIENFTVNGIVTVNVGNNEYYTSVVDGIGYLTVYNLDEGVYNVRVIFEGDNQFNARSFPNVASITVKKMDLVSIAITPRSQVINVTDKATFNVVATSDVLSINDFVTVTIGNKEYVIRLIDGMAILSVDDLSEGDYYIGVSYAGDNCFNSYSRSNISNISVKKINIKNITVSVVNDTIDVGDDSVFIFDVDSNGYVFIDYITVNVLNSEYTVPITNNRGYLTIYSLNENINSMNISYGGNYQFNEYSKTDAVTTTVNKINVTSIKVTSPTQVINVGDDAIFNITLTAEGSVINGYVIASIANKNYTVPIISNYGHLTVNGLTEGNYSLNVSYHGDYQFNSTSFSDACKVEVKKINIEDIKVDCVSPIYVGDDAVFNITVISSCNINGNVIANIGGRNYNVSITDNKGTLSVSGLNNGTFNMAISYLGDDKFNKYDDANVCEVIVNKIEITSIDITPETSNIYAGQDAKLDVEIITDKIINGYVVLKIDNKEYNVSITNNKGNVKVYNLNKGEYNVNVSYAGNNQFNKYYRENAALINVSKVDIDSIVVTPESSAIFVGQNATFNIKINPAVENYVVNGYVNVNINNKNYNVPIVNNTGLFITPALAEGTYNINVSYAGDDIYNAKADEKLASVTVNKVDISSIVVDPMIQNINVGQNASINIEIIPNISSYLLNGYVTVTVGNKSYNVNIINNKGSLMIVGLYSGNYPVNITYAGNDIFNAKSDSQYASIFVNKLYPSISVSADSLIYVGDDSTINITMDSNNPDYIVDGYVTVTVDNNAYNVSIINGNGSLTIKNLASGIYDVYVDYAGNNVYNQIHNNKYTTITVNKIPTTIVMDDVITLNVGDVANIVATINNSTVTGSVKFIVDNKEYVVGIVDGVARLNVTGLNTSANTTVTALYSGDYKFVNSSTTALLDINKVNGNASIIVYDITAGETETVIINLPNDISNGTITVKFNGNVINDYSIENNVISFNMTLQAYGEYNVDINVDNDCKYYNFHNSTSFIVYKVAPENYTIVIDVNDTSVFEKIPVVIILPNDANETVSLSVDNNIIDNVDVVNGVAGYTLDNLSYGNHEISVSYGNVKYSDKTVSANVFVAKIASSVSIVSPEDARVAHDIIIRIIPVGSTGNINVTINDKEYPADNLIVNASDLLEGKYTVVVKLDGDDNYLESTNTTTFVVSRNNVSMSLTNVSGELVVDSPIILHVDFTENVTGTVVFNVNGMNYTVNITESDYAEYTWIPMNEGIVKVTASYSGNNTYYPCNSTENIDFIVSRNLAEFTKVLVHDIKVGDTENITVSLNVTDVTGVILINVNGTVHEVNVLGGLAFLNIPDLQSGNYNVSISYPGDRKYYAINSFSTNFTVSKYDTPIDIIVENIMVLDNATVIITLPGEINDLITIGAGNYSTNVVLADGHASWIISDLPAGNYDVYVNYSGNAKYLSNSSNSSFIVYKHNSTFNVNVSDVYWTDNTNNINMILSDDATGNVTVSINGTDYIVPVINGRADLTVPNLAPGYYESIITYSGDYKYDNISDSFNFIVMDNYPIIESENIIKYYKGSERLRANLTTVRGDKLANETLYISINGVNYTRVTNENGSFSLPLNLPSGDYEAFIVYNSSKYGVINKTLNIEILYTIVSEDLVKVYRNNSQFYAYFTDSEGNALINTTVSFNINGVFYNRTTNASGWAKLNINLPQGTYIITSYNPVTGEARSNVIDVLSRITENYDIIMNYRDGTKFKVCIIGDDGDHVSDGVSVEFNINGVFYTRMTNTTGYATLNINLPSGKYIITTSHLGCLVSNTIIVV